MRIAEGTAKILSGIPIPDEVAVVHRQAAVVDIGSCTTRVGFAGDDAPRINEPTCVVKGSGKEESLCLKKAYESRATANVSRVMVNGEVDWDAMDLLLQHLEEVLMLGTKELYTPLLLTENVLVSRAHRQRLTEMLIEKHAVTSLYFAPSPVLALYAAGTCTGISVEMGNDACYVVPVFQGHSLFHAVHKLNYAGNYFTRYMMSRGAELPEVVHPHHRFSVWEYLKEKCCETCPSSKAFSHLQKADRMESVDLMRNNGENNTHVVQHELPDGSVITLGLDRFMPSEMLFDPSLVSEDVLSKDQSSIENVEQLCTSELPEGIHKLIVDSVNKCDYDLSPTFYNSIHLSGGSSLLRGLPARIGDEVAALTDYSTHVVACKESRHAAFVGGSILASLPTFQDFWVTKADYEEFGSSAVLRRCS